MFTKGFFDSQPNQMLSDIDRPLLLTLVHQFQFPGKSGNHTKEVRNPQSRLRLIINHRPSLDRKSTRLNSSHVAISYAVFCLKKKNTKLRVGPWITITEGDWQHNRDAALSRGAQLDLPLSMQPDRVGSMLVSKSSSMVAQLVE